MVSELLGKPFESQETLEPQSRPKLKVADSGLNKLAILFLGVCARRIWRQRNVDKLGSLADIAAESNFDWWSRLRS